MNLLDRTKGCLLGGAVGDALGAPVEFSKTSTIKHKYGLKGIQDFDTAYGRIGAITDDTQMTLFTAEGLLRAASQAQANVEAWKPIEGIYDAYRRWYYTQTIGSNYGIHKGFLIEKEDLFQSRAPGNTCLGALRTNRMGSLENPPNNSKGCGSVMRVAPCGLFSGTDEEAFLLGMKSSALTHGHRNAIMSSGILSTMIFNLQNGVPLRRSINIAFEMADKYSEKYSPEESKNIIKDAIKLQDRSPEVAIKMLGEGWVAEEALAISIYCALKCESDFNEGIRIAVNHDGDSDSTGAITGNILGTLLGKDAIDQKYLTRLELSDTIEQIAEDLVVRYEDSSEWKKKYPEKS